MGFLAISSTSWQRLPYLQFGNGLEGICSRGDVFQDMFGMFDHIRHRKPRVSMPASSIEVEYRRTLK
jgi:hypothetical protein